MQANSVNLTYPQGFRTDPEILSRNRDWKIHLCGGKGTIIAIPDLEEAHSLTYSLRMILKERHKRHYKTSLTRWYNNVAVLRLISIVCRVRKSPPDRKNALN